MVELPKTVLARITNDEDVLNDSLVPEKTRERQRRCRTAPRKTQKAKPNTQKIPKTPKDAILSVRLTETLKQNVIAEANRASMSLSAYVEMVLAREAAECSARRVTNGIALT